ncbi:type II toxin-antitoxin system YoeB family toxin [Vreelandella alkaliphila]|uniref:Putative mRNA interferase YoeB n=1 Tax=Vreelandella alkaliphila TaxID=272774 RepID=A0AAJ2S2D0_9GAMM|nr:type II toxin-antitoxin system YoeB family toxin [Halomonas alkaliphila]MDX5978639.1 type II toxin-antitoxin system YoeB family toxin [Halomonas alkaliphila]
MSRRLLSWTDESWSDSLHWQTSAVKGKLSWFWSRRIDDTNRLVYAVDDNAITIILCRYHY